MHRVLQCAARPAPAACGCTPCVGGGEGGTWQHARHHPAAGAVAGGLAASRLRCCRMHVTTGWNGAHTAAAAALCPPVVQGTWTDPCIPQPCTCMDRRLCLPVMQWARTDPSTRPCRAPVPCCCCPAVPLSLCTLPAGLGRSTGCTAGTTAQHSAPRTRRRSSGRQQRQPG